MVVVVECLWHWGLNVDWTEADNRGVPFIQFNQKKNKNTHVQLTNIRLIPPNPLPSLPQLIQKPLGPLPLGPLQPRNPRINPLLLAPTTQIQIPQPHADHIAILRVNALDGILVVASLPPLLGVLGMCLAEFRRNAAGEQDFG